MDCVTYKLTGKINKFHFNEWTFTSIIFVVSFSIFLSKVIINYGTYTNPIIHLGLSNQNMHFDASNFIQSTMNASIYYEDLINNKAIDLFKDYYWLLKALITGTAITAFTWLIIYKDSHVPGINPPSPFSPQKKNYRSEPQIHMHINYLLGLAIGIFIFIYMCFKETYPMK